MNNPFAYYNSHMDSPVNYANSPRETEIEYIFRVAREKEAAEKAERRRARIASLKAAFRSLLKSTCACRTTSPQSLIGH